MSNQRVAGAALGGLLLTLVTACSGSAPSAISLADKQRRPVAREYWKIYQAVHGATGNYDDTTGRFNYCAGSKSRLRYEVIYYAFGLTAKEPHSQINAALMARLKTIGWNLSPSDSLHYSATHGDLTVQTFWPSSEPKNAQWVVTLVVHGGCIDYGKNTASVLKVVDEYPKKDAASSPVPTGLATRTP
ncbi:hypothetical protein [Streptomyces sp. NBC_00448]|uniref:hypothetical protein n=1 Tax=Streptomyces sp. NBC_00448 TaxID=2903652 RepID=UPI002E212827